MLYVKPRTMPSLATALQIQLRQGQCYDIRDVYGFVRGTIHRSGIRFFPDEYEELVAEGVVILLELACGYEPHRAGHATAGRFSGYAAAYLPKKLGRAWHRWHPEHYYARAEGETKRRWYYGQGHISLDGYLAESDAMGGVGEAGLHGQSHWVSHASIPLIATHVAR